MTIMGSSRDRCRLCFSLFGRDRSSCCQKSYHLFKHVERRKLPVTKRNSFSIPTRNRTVCFHDLVRRYLQTSIHPLRNSSNLICADCSVTLLDIEQCAKYLRKTIDQLKVKLTKSDRLQTSSLSATFQRKHHPREQLTTVEQTPIPLSNSDSNDEFDEMNDEEEFDEEVKGRPSKVSESLLRTSPLLFPAGDSSSSVPMSKVHSMKTNVTNEQCNDFEDDDEDEDDEDDEDGLIKSSPSEHRKTHLASLTDRLQANARNISPNANGFLPMANKSINLLEDHSPHVLQARLAQMIASPHSSNSGSHLNDHNNIDSAANVFAQIQRNLLFQFLNDPIAAAQAAQAAAAAAAVMSTTPMKANLVGMPLLSSKTNNNNNKQMGSGRKRKSTPEKRVVTNHRSSSNNEDISPTIEQEAFDPTAKNGSADHPLELTVKGYSRSTQALGSPAKSTGHVHNLVSNSMLENGGFQYQQHATIDEDHQESVPLNDSSLSLSPPLSRRPITPKRPKSSPSSSLFDTSKVISSHTGDLLSPNHQPVLNDETNPAHQQKQQKKLDPRSCMECGKVLFSDKTHLLHCQTHAKNEKQCWICAAHDDDMKKHILTEHSNQKFSTAGFKCQHCEKVFPVFADLEAHTREHSKKKPFECPICHKRFGQQGNLSCHLRIHSGVKPFNCASCGKAFRHSNSLRRHARTVHSVSRGLTMSPGSMATTTTPSSLLLATASTSNSMVTMANDVHRLSTSEAYDDGTSGLLIASDEGESLQGANSPLSSGAPSPSVSNIPMDSDSPDPLGTG